MHIKFKDETYIRKYGKEICRDEIIDIHIQTNHKIKKIKDYQTYLLFQEQLRELSKCKDFIQYLSLILEFAIELIKLIKDQDNLIINHTSH